MNASELIICDKVHNLPQSSLLSVILLTFRLTKLRLLLIILFARNEQITLVSFLYFFKCSRSTSTNAADGIRTRNVSVVVNFKFTVSRQLHHCDRNMGSGGATHKCLVKLRDCAKRNDFYFVTNLNNDFTRTIKVELHFGAPFISQPYLYSISYFLGLFKFFLLGTLEVFYFLS